MPLTRLGLVYALLNRESLDRCELSAWIDVVGTGWESSVATIMASTLARAGRVLVRCFLLPDRAVECWSSAVLRVGF